MSDPVPIRVAIVGQLPVDFDLKALGGWKSKVFRITDTESFHLNEDADGMEWEFADEQFERFLNAPFPQGIQLLLVNVPLELNWYVRRLSHNRVVLSFQDIAAILRINNIPLRNIVLRVLYAATLIFRRYGNRVPVVAEITDYAHDETRGCLFDMNANKWDIVASCHNPCLCDGCVAALRDSAVSNEQIDLVRKEIAGITKPLFNRIADFVRHHPVWSIVISILAALLLGTISSVLGSVIVRGIYGAT